MSLSISKHIYAKLSASDSLKAFVSDRLYAISTKSETSFPFIIYKRSALSPAGSKDRESVTDSVTVDVIIADEDHFRSVEIAELVRSAIEGKRGKYDTFDVNDCRLSAADEDFIEDTFIQRLTFSFETD
ncbi:tail completion protein gp17 [Bacteroides sp.]|uniref:tail completion protein gp17 n=1 Tax=Bacteroides sp. TaxID=29523 RepID=UPI002FCBC215